jgi:phosphatidylglycerol lysyltransferase
MTGFHEGERATVEDRVIHSSLQKLDFLFSFRGLYRYKAKFATSWEPRYLIYKNMLQLPRTALALHRLSETNGETDAGLPGEERQAYNSR